MATATPNYLGFNLNPGTQGGSGAYGGVPGAIGAPPSIYSQVNSAVPGAAGLAAGSAANIGSEIAGQLSPGTENLLQNKAASMGVNVGQPGGAPGNTISNQNFLDNLGLTSEQLSQTGNNDYLKFLGGVGAAQLDPSLLASIASNNATMAAAPNPAAAAAQQQALMQQWYNMTNNPAGGTKQLDTSGFGRLVGGTPQNGTFTSQGSQYYGLSGGV